MQVLDHGYVNLVESWGSDERIIEAARMSTDKGFLGWGPIHETPEVCRLHPEYCCCDLKPGDEKLLRYLWEHHHTSPFEMAGAVFEVYAPIFVVREWQRHRVQALSEGLSFNEMSGRYVELPDNYYIPSIERLMSGKQHPKNKQASEAGFTAEEALEIQTHLSLATARSRSSYEFLLDKGVAREIARLVLPVSQYTRLRASANLWGWLHFLG